MCKWARMQECKWESFTIMKYSRESLSGGYMIDFSFNSLPKKPTNYPLINKRLYLAFNEWSGSVLPISKGKKKNNAALLHKYMLRASWSAAYCVPVYEAPDNFPNISSKHKHKKQNAAAIEAQAQGSEITDWDEWRRGEVKEARWEGTGRETFVLTTPLYCTSGRSVTSSAP